MTSLPHPLIAVVFGTRPEAIKMAPVVAALRRRAGVRCLVCVTAQHREMLDQVLSAFRIRPDADLALMRPKQSLADLTARAVRGLTRWFESARPDLVLVQGDTTTSLCAALAAFYCRIPVAHVEAGLRTGRMDAPWPEEANRVLISRLACLHFAPTTAARDNLLREGVPADRIHVTGNTVIDALLQARTLVRRRPPRIPGLPAGLQPGRKGPRVVLITGHRRENLGEGMDSICRAIRELAGRFPDVHFVYPVHRNPGVRGPVERELGPAGGNAPENVHLLEPLPYLSFVALMDRACLILTDSGGVQEEAPSLGKPVLVMREVTERPEAVRAGGAQLVGTDPARIVRAASRALSRPSARTSRPRNPYGDGRAAGRIVAACRAFLRAQS